MANINFKHDANGASVEASAAIGRFDVRASISSAGMGIKVRGRRVSLSLERNANSTSISAEADDRWLAVSARTLRRRRRS